MFKKEGDKKGYKYHLTCSEYTKSLIRNDCVEEFLNHHPEFNEVNITDNFILKKIGEFYRDQ